MDPTHVRTFTEHSFDFFGKRKNRLYYSNARFDVVRVDYKYNATAVRHFRSKRLLKILSHYLNNVLEDLYFELRAIKKTKVGKQSKQTLFDIARCPHCARKTGGVDRKMVLHNKSWLICKETGCKRKYPIYDGLPILTGEEGEKWRSRPVSKLPKTPPHKPAIIRIEND
jgi:uncharacterized protein YbaR (Trm112 family)